MILIRSLVPLVLMLSLVSCLGGGGDTSEKQEEQDPIVEHERLRPEDPLYRYDPPIEVSTVRATDQAMKFAEGESLDENIWTRIFMEQYGIKVNNMWVVDSLQYNRKLNVTIATGNLPDFFHVSKEEMKQLYESGQLADLTDILDAYGSGYLKQVLGQNQGTSLKTATFDGKLVGLPRMMVNGGVSTAEMLWVRTDWLKKLSLPEPRTAADVVRIAEAFAKEDPDGNGLDDTAGLGINNELFMYHGSLKGFFNGYGAYPEIWTVDSTGRLVYGSIQPEMKLALSKLAEMYRMGYLDPEFMVKSWSRLAKEIADGKLGMAYGSVSDGGYIQRESRANDPGAEWRPYPLVSPDGGDVHPQLLDMAESYYVVRKDSPHPEAVVKLANIYLRHYYEMDYSPEPNPFISSAGGIHPGRYQPVTTDPTNLNLDAYRKVQAALKSGTSAGLTFPATVHYDRLTAYEKGDEEMWFSTVVFGSQGSYSVIDHYDQRGLGLYNAYQGAATPAMAERMSTLNRLQDDTFTKIIMGELPIQAFDEFVTEWRSLGGNQMTLEVNEWNSRQPSLP